ncbi:MAG: hypothetical protein CVV64_00660 [Candidatus Wallbacteria bacterium HGW-Wallbacteria-1]|jgi:adenylate cyclase class 1|uniref:Adenylate cyclase class-I N-terminal domain-containing protein n=1 Tax=Candidatus Wallbacteria bacterium HGW-Wallbacteria-1 TaxID=2013854 RepID=A0A2N1PUG3_9BACT|nr:MAG: hypothetical protein CVV64_00660 [Candidatus Wallbacteria bacterium HGW-Wallbacteria-1]
MKEIQDIQEIRRRMARNYRAFAEYNRIRIDKTFQTIGREGQKCLSIIPLLLHLNERILPGFLDDERTPHGIANFEWDKSAVDNLKDLFPTANIQRRSLARHAIDCLAIMGSCGSIAMTQDSDFDFWLCFEKAKLNTDEITLLQKKATLIEKWADEKGLEVHFFLMDVDQIYSNRFGEADAESSGSAQAHLLKEEFYRTFIMMAGKYPFWCLVPFDSDDKIYEMYRMALPGSQEIDEHGFVDLGNICSIPPDEYYGATLWQIVKGYKNPFKSLLKIGVLQVYFEESSGLLLCNEIKKEIQRRALPPYMIDPYVGMFRRLISYNTSKGDNDKDRLLKICFYLKTGFSVKSIEEAAKRIGDLNTRINRNEFSVLDANELIFLKQFMDWGWNSIIIKDMNSFNTWPFEKVVDLGERMNGFALEIYRSLTGKLASTGIQHCITPVDITVLGRKIQSLYRELPHKIQTIYHVKEHHIEKIITFYCDDESPQEKRWHLFKTAVSKSNFLTKGPFVLKTSPTIQDLMFWVIHNDLYRPTATSVSVKTDHPALNASSVKACLDELFHFFHQISVSKIDNALLLAKPQIERLYFMCIPLSLDPEAKPRKFHLSCFSRNTWGEEFVRTANCEQPLVKTLEFLREQPLVESARKGFKTGCFVPHRGLMKTKADDPLGMDSLYPNLIASMLKKLGGKILSFISREPFPVRQYLTSLPGKFIVLHNDGNICEQHFDTPFNLCVGLSRPSKAGNRTYVDEGNTDLTPLRTAYSLWAPGYITVAVFRRPTYHDLFIIDESGNLVFQPVNPMKFSKNIKAINTFLESSIELIREESPEGNFGEESTENIIKYWDITEEDLDRLKRNSDTMGEMARNHSREFVEISIEKIRTGGYFFQLGEDDIFSTRMHESPMEALATRLRDILARRGENEFFLTKVFLEEGYRTKFCGQIPATSHYLLYRNVMTQHLQRLLAKLASERSGE